MFSKDWSGNEPYINDRGGFRSDSVSGPGSFEGFWRTYYQMNDWKSEINGYSSYDEWYLWGGTPGESRTFNVTTYTVGLTQGYIKGDSLNKIVRSNNRNDYPDNNYSGSTWYVYKGVY